MRILNLIDRRALVCDKLLAVDQKLILLRLAAENGMVFEDQTFHTGTGFTLEKRGCSEPADSAADNYAVIDLPCINDSRRKRIVQAVTNRMTSLQDIPSVSIRVAVFTDAAITSEVIALGG
jgi:hypothetical protein